MPTEPSPVHIQAYQLAYLLVGEVEGAARALLETIRLQDRSAAFPWDELAHAAIRQAAALSPDRFFLRTLASPDGITAQVDRLPESERRALVLEASGLFTPEQIASLVRLPKGALTELLARTWRQVGVERSTLWASLLTTVPPMERGLQRQVESVLAGDPSSQADPVDASAFEPGHRSSPRRRVPWPFLLVVVTLLGLLANRFWPRERAAIPTEAVLVQEVPPPAPESGRFDPGAYKPEAVQSFTTAGTVLPIEEGARSVAEKLFQWLGEATFVAEAPYVTPGQSPNTLSLRFTDGRVIWFQPENQCWVVPEQCSITVGGEGKIPVRLQQTDLSRWVVAGGWMLEIAGHAPYALYADRSGLRVHTEEQIRALTQRDGQPGLEVVGVTRMMLLRVEQENGLWRTSGDPAWQVLLRLTEGERLEGLMLIYQDKDGTLLERMPVHFARRTG